MLFPRPGRWVFGFALLMAAAGSPCPAANSLPGSSPFLPPATAAGEGAATADAQLELRGIMTVGDATMFSIYDTTHHSSVWTKANETGRDFVVRGYDANRDTVTVEYQGRTLTLPLHSAKVVAAPVTIPQAIPAQAVVGAPQPVGGPVVLNPTPADEQRRLEAIAAEVNRRRAMRQQALQNNNRLPPNTPGGPTQSTPGPNR